MRAAVYDKDYVTSLVIAKWSLTGIIICMAAFIAYLLIDARGYATHINQLKDTNNSLLVQLSEYNTKVAVVEDYINKVNPKISTSEVRRISIQEVVSSKASGVPLSLGLAITQKESAFNCKAISPTQPVGCKQIAVSHWDKELGYNKSQLMNIETNIKSGYYILARLIYESKDVNKALRRYYGGTQEQNSYYADSVLDKQEYIQRKLGV